MTRRIRFCCQTKKMTKQDEIVGIKLKRGGWPKIIGESIKNVRDAPARDPIKKKVKGNQNGAESFR